MRKLLIAALAATALVPNVAAAQTYRHHRQEQRQINRERRQANNQRRRITNERRAANNERRALNNERRQVHREEWREYRRTHRNVFTRPRFIWPRGYSYRPLGVGAILDQLFWGPEYRLNYYTYRLPYPGRYREWVRYGNDALLIDDRTGRVVMVYRDFFY